MLNPRFIIVVFYFSFLFAHAHAQVFDCSIEVEFPGQQSREAEFTIDTERLNTAEQKFSFASYQTTWDSIGPGKKNKRLKIDVWFQTGSDVSPGRNYFAHSVGYFMPNAEEIYHVAQYETQTLFNFGGVSSKKFQTAHVYCAPEE